MMRTLAEHRAAILAARKDQSATAIATNLDKLEAIEGRAIALYVETNPIIRGSDPQRQRDGMRAAIRDHGLDWIGIACDGCGTELVNRSPGVVTASNPPLRCVGCPGCGWIGWAE